MDKYYFWIRLYWLEVLVVLYLFFIVYTTIIPFNFVGCWETLQLKFIGIHWLPFTFGGEPLNKSDIFANIIFFIPLGLLLALKIILKEYRNLVFKEWMLIILKGTCVSIFVELLQLFTIDRQTSTTDVLMNSFGTFIGAGIILIVYLRFHILIKKILFRLFVNKPEIIIAGLFLLFIFISQSAPFNFQIGLYSISHEFNDMITVPFDFNEFITNLLFNIIVYGSLSYFVFTGTNRYFSYLFNIRLKIMLLIMLCFLPVMLELYQLVLPFRNHSLYEMVTAQIAVIFGFSFFLYHSTKFKNCKDSNSMEILYFQSYLDFFKVLSLVYIVFLVSQGILNEQKESISQLFEILNRNKDKLSHFEIKYMRLNLLIYVTKGVFTFLPVGFIISLFWSIYLRKGKTKYQIIFFILLLSIILIFFKISYVENYKLMGRIIINMSGICLGYVSWRIFEYLFQNRML
jgi:glycopeptide antibiotics resistance protein